MADTGGVLEVWKNATHGMRWVKQHDRAGNDVTKLVQAGRTFSVTPLDRQLNQDESATPEQDLFRNGTFVLVKPSDETNHDEIQSPDSITENEVIALSQEVLGTPERIDRYLKGIESPVALNRILEQLIVDDADKDAIAYVRMKKEKFDPSTRAAVTREVVREPDPEPEVVTPRGGIPTADTPDYVKTEPEKFGS